MLFIVVYLVCWLIIGHRSLVIGHGHDKQRQCATLSNIFIPLPELQIAHDHIQHKLNSFLTGDRQSLI